MLTGMDVSLGGVRMNRAVIALSRQVMPMEAIQQVADRNRQVIVLMITMMSGISSISVIEQNITPHPDISTHAEEDDP